MLYIPKIGDYIKILTDGEMNDSVAINFNVYFKSTREKCYSKLNEKQIHRKVANRFISFATLGEAEKYAKMIQLDSSDNCIHYYNVEILKIFDPELQLINIKPMIEIKLK